MKKAKERSKGPRADRADPSISDHIGEPPAPGYQDLVDLLEEVTYALEQATAQVASMGAPHPEALGSPAWISEPCGPAWDPRRSGRALSDPMLLDRYQGMLVRSGLVGGSVHHLPSRLRERLEAVLRELVVGVARERPATGAQVDALVAELIIVVGERVACTVENWRDAAD